MFALRWLWLWCDYALWAWRLVVVVASGLVGLCLGFWRRIGLVGRMGLVVECG